MSNFIPDCVQQNGALGRATINTQNNWWETRAIMNINALKQNPSIIDIVPFLSTEDSFMSGICIGDEQNIRVIPTTSKWGYIVMTLLFLGSSVYYIRYRRA